MLWKVVANTLCVLVCQPNNIPLTMSVGVNQLSNIIIVFLPLDVTNVVQPLE